MITNDHGLFINSDTNAVVGYLFAFDGKGVYSPDGKVEITPEQAKKHNELLSEAELKGLDAAAIGQWGTLYFNGKEVKTWMGNLVSSNVTKNGKSITFKRNGRTYRGTERKDADCFNFKRIS